MLAHPAALVSGAGSWRRWPTCERDTPESEFDSHWKSSRNIRPLSFNGART